jgi:transcriptional regulator with XRE-family HTH domain
MARKLGVSAAHLTDIEKGRRAPSEQLLMKIATAYSLDEAQLRAGWRKADAIVQEVATQDALAAKKVPHFLRTARHLTEEQWNQIIEKARRLAKKKRGATDA